MGLPTPAATAAGADAFSELLHGRPDAAFDYLEFRRALAGEAAAMAARRATPADLDRLRAAMTAMEEAHTLDDPRQEAALDADFHLAIYLAAHNAVMAHVMAHMLTMLREDVFYDRADLYLRGGVRDGLLRQHRAIFEAIVEGDPEAARTAATVHLAAIAEALREAQHADLRLEVARRRRDGSGLVPPRSRI